MICVANNQIQLFEQSLLRVCSEMDGRVSIDRVIVRLEDLCQQFANLFPKQQDTRNNNIIFVSRDKLEPLEASLKALCGEFEQGRRVNLSNVANLLVVVGDSYIKCFKK